MPLLSPLVFALGDADDKSGWPTGAVVVDDGKERREVSRCGGNGRFSANKKASGIEGKAKGNPRLAKHSSQLKLRLNCEGAAAE